MFCPYLATVLKKSCAHKKCTFDLHLVDNGNGPGLHVHTIPSTDHGQNGPHALLQRVILAHVNRNVLDSAKADPLVTIQDVQKIRTPKRYEINNYDFELI